MIHFDIIKRGGIIIGIYCKVFVGIFIIDFQRIFNYHFLKYLSVIMIKLAIIFFLIFSVSTLAQFRDDGLNKPSVKEGIVDENSGFSIGFLNSENFHMSHSFSMSYTSFGGNGISLGTYTNSMFYRLMDNMNVQMDVSFIYSPYSTFGQNFQNDINGIYISRAAVNYSPFKDMHISVQYRSLPYSNYYFNPYFGSFNDSRGDPFGN